MTVEPASGEVFGSATAASLFLAEHGLPERWQGRDQFTVLDTRFGLGDRFLAAWDAWRRDPLRCARLSFVAIAAHPATRDALRNVARDPSLAALAQALIDAWPPLTPNLHRLSFEAGRVELLLAVGDVRRWLPALTLRADAFHLVDVPSAADPRPWDVRICKALGRLAAADATLVALNPSPALRANLSTAGFALQPDPGGERAVTLGRYAPRFVPRGTRPPANTGAQDDRRALVLGGGLAGAATAWALAERGWQSVIVERRPALADEASGNPAGIFHATVHAQDGPHARLHRAAALAAGTAVRVAIDAHGARGAVDGLLRLETTLALPAMASLLASLGLPANCVTAVDAATASELAGVPIAGPAWHFPGGGWVAPAGLVRSFVARAGERVTLHCGVEVQSIRRVDGRWELRDAAGALIDAAGTLVLANAGDALRLLGGSAWPMVAVRGQISLLPIDAAPVTLATCRRPVVGSGYLLPASNAHVMFGATSQPGDTDPAVRDADHLLNLARLRRLTTIEPPIDTRALTGRTAWRWVTADRLPLIGAAPAEALWQGHHAHRPSWDQPRCVPREPGLFVFSGLASRGIGWSALGGQCVAAAITGTPWPLESSLAAAVDPARFISRAQRRRTAGGA